MFKNQKRVGCDLKIGLLVNRRRRRRRRSSCKAKEQMLKKKMRSNLKRCDGRMGKMRV